MQGETYTLQGLFYDFSGPVLKDAIYDSNRFAVILEGLIPLYPPSFFDLSV